ncbi:hypothetical protein FHG87_019730, partial [Trinorchestia longiramus]
ICSLAVVPTPVHNDCTTTTEQNCCNCGGNYIANYGECPKMEQAKEVKITCQLQKLFDRDVVKQVLKQTAIPPTQSKLVLPTNMILPRHQPDSGYLQNAKTLKIKTVGFQTNDKPYTPTQKHVTIN